MRRAIKLGVNNKHTPRECRQEKGQARGVHAASVMCCCIGVGIVEIERRGGAVAVCGLGWAWGRGKEDV